MKYVLPTVALTLLSAVFSIPAAMANSITVDSNARMRPTTDHTFHMQQSDKNQKENSSSKKMHQSMNLMSGTKLAHVGTQLKQKQDIPGYCAPFVSSHEAANDPLYQAAIFKCKYGT